MSGLDDDERAVDRRVAEQVALAHRRTAAVAGAGARQLALGIVSPVESRPTPPTGLRADEVGG